MGSFGQEAIRLFLWMKLQHSPSMEGRLHPPPTVPALPSTKRNGKQKDSNIYLEKKGKLSFKKYILYHSFDHHLHVIKSHVKTLQMHTSPWIHE